MGARYEEEQQKKEESKKKPVGVAVAPREKGGKKNEVKTKFKELLAKNKSKCNYESVHALYKT
jgi:hypothetical protein